MKENKSSFYVYWQENEPHAYLKKKEVINDVIEEFTDKEKPEALPTVYQINKGFKDVADIEDINIAKINEVEIWKTAYMEEVNKDFTEKQSALSDLSSTDEDNESEKDKKFQIETDKRDIEEVGLPKEKWMEIIKRRRNDEYICPVCGEILDAPQSVSSHMQCHNVSGVRCTICGETFETNSAVNTHKERIHGYKDGTDDKIKFDLEKVNRMNEDLPADIKMIRDKPIEERDEEETVMVADFLDDQLEKQKPTCPICFETFDSLQAMAAHMIHHDYEGHLCSRCGRLFETEEEKYKHGKKEHRP